MVHGCLTTILRVLIEITIPSDIHRELFLSTFFGDALFIPEVVARIHCSLTTAHKKCTDQKEPNGFLGTLSGIVSGPSFRMSGLDVSNPKFRFRFRLCLVRPLVQSKECLLVCGPFLVALLCVLIRFLVRFHHSVKIETSNISSNKQKITCAPMSFDGLIAPWAADPQAQRQNTCTC